MPTESHSSPPLLSSNLGIALLTRAWLFQAIIATPIALVLGFSALGCVYDGYYTKIYDFIMYLGNTILAGAIIFIVLVQRQLKPDTFLRAAQGKLVTFWFEIIKSVVATALWLWILLDAIFNTNRNYYDDKAKMRRVMCCIIAYIVLILFWYPTVWYSHYSMKNHSEEVEEDAVGEGEGAPLLGNETV